MYVDILLYFSLHYIADVIVQRTNEQLIYS